MKIILFLAFIVSFFLNNYACLKIKTKDNFKEEAQNIRLVDNYILKADLKTWNGEIHKDASINLNNYISIDNNGSLKWGEKGFSSFCNNCLLVNDSILTCFCINRFGIYKLTQLELNSKISNIDGNLRYDF